VGFRVKKNEGGRERSENDERERERRDGEKGEGK
jgi:hypothetical protein